MSKFEKKKLRWKYAGNMPFLEKSWTACDNLKTKN